MIGQMLGPYRVLEKLGEGGMGEVYKARDTRLDRSVAIKVLPTHLSADPDRRARFEREAKTIAGLNHPHICTLHDVGEHPSTGSTGSPQASSGQATLYLVMEHLTGETLAQRLEKGPLPLEQALTLATEIADALAAAHRQGVIHRDLKPGNVMLTKAGAKLLDFGLAKLKGHGEQPAAAHLASAPTQSTPLTGEGMIVGTLQYMAPEQLEGKSADARTDLWALGTILYEMVTGRRAFEGTSAASLIGAILERDPAPLSTLQPLTPPALDRLVRQCLAKSPDDRPDTAHDVANDLRWLHESSGVEALAGTRPRRRPGVRTALSVVAGLLLFAAGAGVMWLVRPSTPQPLLVRSLLEVRPAEQLNAGGVPEGSTWLPTAGGSRTAMAWTPDGRALVFVGRRGGVQQLYVRRLDAAEARPLANTEGAQAPAVSPDGQWVAFWAEGTIRKVPFGGGPVTDLASGIEFPAYGVAWDARGGLLFGRSDGRIWAIRADGKLAAATTLGEGEQAHTLPSLLPGGRVLLYTVRKRWQSWGDELVVAQPLPSGDRTLLLTDAADARYVPPTGHLVFLRRGVLYAVPFDVERLQPRGPEVAVLDGVAQALTASHGYDLTGAGQFAVAPTGALAWIPGPVVPFGQKELVTVDRRGRATPLLAPVRSYGSEVRVSPDQRRLAVTLRDVTKVGLWVYDLVRPAPLLRLTTEGEVSNPIWCRGGQELAFTWITNGREVLAAQPADGTAPPRVLVPGFVAPLSLAPDGRQFAAVRNLTDIVMVTLEDGKARVGPPIQTLQHAFHAVFSPDGHWLAYASDVSGRSEVYVQPYPGPGPGEPVSAEGGWSPAWHPNGRELFFVSGTDSADKSRMMAAEFVPGSPPKIGRPKELFSFDRGDFATDCFPTRCYDVAADGQRFYAVKSMAPPPTPVVTHINLILNWAEELKAKVPTGR